MLLKGIKIFQKIYIIKSYLEKQPEFRWCANPKGCGSGQLVENWESLKGYYTCNACKTELCFKHRVAYHFGFTCDEYDRELENNPTFFNNYVLN